jgi:hypothetical protein
VYFGGAGIGIVLSGVGIPWLLAFAGRRGMAQRMACDRRPLVPFALASIHASHRSRSPRRAEQRVHGRCSDFRGARLPATSCSSGYIAYMTFVVAWMVPRGASPLGVSADMGHARAATDARSDHLAQCRALAGPAARTLAAVGVVIGIGAAIPLYSASLPANGCIGVLFRHRDVLSTYHRSPISSKERCVKGGVGSGPCGLHRRVRHRPGDRPGADRMESRTSTHSLNASLAASVVILSLRARLRSVNARPPVAPERLRAPQHARERHHGAGVIFPIGASPSTVQRRTTRACVCPDRRRRRDASRSGCPR